MNIQSIKHDIAEAVRQTVDELNGQPVQDWLERPPQPEMGDFGLPCFKLAPILKRDPTDIAGDLAERITPPDVFSKVTNEGPYLNFHIDRIPFIRETLTRILDAPEDWAFDNVGEGEPVVIDYSSPNIAKPFSVGHLRSTAIGAVLYRIYDKLGFDAIGINHLGDWGTQCGKQLLAFEKWGDHKELEENGVHYLQNLYVRINEAIEEDQELQERAREWFNRLERGDEKATELWKTFREHSIDYLKSIYDRLGVEFDEYIGESFYHDLTEDVLDEVDDAGLLTESEGALIVELDDEDKPPFLLRKKDGSTLYSTRDLAAALYRHREYNSDRLIYVVASEQNLHFEQLFSVLRKMDHDWVEKCEHVEFGLVQLKEGKMSTRKGSLVLLEDLINRCKEIIKERQEDHLKNSADPVMGRVPSEEDIDQKAEEVGVGSVLFSDLKDDRTRDFQFDRNKAIGYDPNTGSFRGETGPYLQYTHVRIKGLQRENQNQKNLNFQTDLKEAAKRLERPEEYLLIREVAVFPEILKRTLHTHQPSVLAGYLIDLAQQFNRYYHDQENHTVISEDEELSRARLAMSEAVRLVLEKGMNLLGLKAIDWM